MSIPVVNFSQMTEFLTELADDGPPSGIVRVTQAIYPSAQIPISRVFIIASYVNGRGEIVQLKGFIGEDWGKGMESTEKTADRANKAADELRQKIDTLAYEVRAGRFVTDTQ